VTSRTRSIALGALAGCCVVTGCVIGSQVSAQTPFDSQVTADGGALVECLEVEDRPLAVLFLVDDSASLKKRDPGTSRVPALQASISSLGAVAETRDVYVDIYRFGTETVRAFDDLPSWARLTGELPSELEDRIRAFAGWQDAVDTDYATALLRATEVLPDAPAGACRLIVWFTDGQLDFEYKGAPKEREWTDFVIGSRADADRAKLLAVAELCGENALVDALRGNDLTSDGAFIAAVALGDSDEFDLLRRIVANRDGDCGLRPAKGTIASTFDVADLTGLLVRSVDPAPPGATADLLSIGENECAAPLDPSAPGAFTVHSSLSAMRARFESTHPNVRAVLVAPEEISGSKIVDLGRTAELSSPSGMQVRTKTLSDRLSSATLEFPTRLGAWAGSWEFRFCTADPGLVGSNGRVEILSVNGLARAEIVEGISLRRGRSGTVSAQLIGRGGDRIDGGSLGIAQPVLTSPGSELGPVEVDATGRLRAAVDIPEDFASDSLIVEADLKPQVEVFPPGRIWTLSSWNGELAELEVRPLPVYPLVELPRSFDVIDQDNLIRRAAVRIVAAGDESAGCLTLTVVSFNDELPDDAGQLAVRVLDGERTIIPGDLCSIELLSGDERDLTIEVQASPEQARLAGLYAGTLAMTSTSAIDPSQSEEFSYPIEIRVRPLTVIELPSAELLFIYFALAALAPIALLYMYNFVWGARLDVVSTPLVTVPFSYDGRSLHRHDPLGGAAGLTVAADDVRPWGTSSGRPRRLIGRLPDGQELRLRARVSWLPWGQPYATSEIGGHRLQLGPLGRLRRTGAGHIGLSTSGLWVAGMTPVANHLGPVAAANDRISDPSAWDGVIAVLPGMVVGSDVVGRTAQILATAHDSISLILESDEADRIAQESVVVNASTSQPSGDGLNEEEPHDHDDLPGTRTGHRSKGTFEGLPSTPGQRKHGSDGMPTSDGPFGRGASDPTNWPTSGGDGLPP
jgi:hypothetical protein